MCYYMVKSKQVGFNKFQQEFCEELRSLDHLLFSLWIQRLPPFISNSFLCYYQSKFFRQKEKLTPAIQRGFLTPACLLLT